MSDQSGDDDTSNDSKKPRLTRAAAKREKIRVTAGGDDSNSRDSFGLNGGNERSAVSSAKPKLEKDEGSFSRGSIYNPYSDGVIHVGGDYQVPIPEMLDESCDVEEKVVCLWAPDLDKISDKELEHFCTVAREQYMYSTEQALGILQWHGYDMQAALADFGNYVPIKEEWSTEDKVLFEQAYAFHGKNFGRIRQLIPHKTMASLVDYYYLWKKSRHYTSYLDKHSDSEESDHYDPDPSPVKVVKLKRPQNYPKCSNCSEKLAEGEGKKAQKLCDSCHLYWKRSGDMRPVIKKKTEKGENAQEKGQTWPFSFKLSCEDFEEFAQAAAGHQWTATQTGGTNKLPKTKGDEYLKTLDYRVHGLRQKAVRYHNEMKQLKGKLVNAMSDFRLSGPKPRIVYRWTENEKLIAVQAFARYGKNFHAIAEVVGTKNSDMIRQFYKDYGTKYRLDTLIKEHEEQKKERKEEMLKKEIKEEIIIDLVDDSSPPPKPKEVEIVE